MTHDFDWSDLAFGSKEPLRELKATFIAAPRELSQKRLTQLIKTYLPGGNIILGLSKEQYVDGFEGQSQFEMLDHETVKPLVDKVNASSPHKIVTLHYFQRELPFLLEKIKCRRTVFVNGSWKYLFHTQPQFYTLVNQHIPYELVSPFCDEDEARSYLDSIKLPALLEKGAYSEVEMLTLADQAATHSFDNGFQTGVSLGERQGDNYRLLATTFNAVVPYQTYAWHYGATREINFSPMHDLNHYDTIHAEVSLIVTAQKRGIDLNGTTLFINLLPCPTCARMFTQTDIDEFVYREDHSEGYAIKMLELAGKKVRRVV
jgi:deoxycytidylate deaminase